MYGFKHSPTNNYFFQQIQADRAPDIIPPAENQNEFGSPFIVQIYLDQFKIELLNAGKESHKLYKGYNTNNKKDFLIGVGSAVFTYFNGTSVHSDMFTDFLLKLKSLTGSYEGNNETLKNDLKALSDLSISLYNNNITTGVNDVLRKYSSFLNDPISPIFEDNSSTIKEGVSFMRAQCKSAQNVAN